MFRSRPDEYQSAYPPLPPLRGNSCPSLFASHSSAQQQPWMNTQLSPVAGEITIRQVLAVLGEIRDSGAVRDVQPYARLF